MKLLLDENLPHELRHRLIGHDVFTTTFMGWSGLDNGELLAAAAAEGFDAVLTMDGGIPYQQNPATLPCAVVLLRAESNTIRHLAPLVPALLAALEHLHPRSVLRVG